MQETFAFSVWIITMVWIIQRRWSVYEGVRDPLFPVNVLIGLFSSKRLGLISRTGK